MRLIDHLGTPVVVGTIPMGSWGKGLCHVTIRLRGQRRMRPGRAGRGTQERLTRPLRASSANDTLNTQTPLMAKSAGSSLSARQPSVMSVRNPSSK